MHQVDNLNVQAPQTHIDACVIEAAVLNMQVNVTTVYVHCDEKVLKACTGLGA